MQQIPDIQWKRSAKRNPPGLFVGNDEDEDWIAANAAEVPPPKQPVAILEKGFEMLGRTFDAFESTIAGKQPEGQKGGSKEEDRTTQSHGAPVALKNGWTKDKRATPLNGEMAAPANGTKIIEGRTARNSAPVAQMNGHKTSEHTSSHDESTNGINYGVGNKGEERLPAKEQLPIIQKTKSSKRSSTLSPPNTSSKGSPVRDIKRAKTSIEDNLATEKPQHRGSITPQPITPRSKSSKRSSTFSPPNTSSKGSPVRTIKRAKTGMENNLATEKPQRRGSDNPQAAAGAKNKHSKSKPHEIDGIDISNKTSAPKGNTANGPKSHGGSSSPTEQDNPPTTKYGYSPVKEKSARDLQLSPKKYKTCEYLINTARHESMLICIANFSMPKQRFSNISSFVAAASAHKPRNPRDMDSDDPYGQGLYSDVRRWR